MSQPHPTFLSISHDIRHLIYRSLLTTDRHKPLCPFQDKIQQSYIIASTPLHPTILRVCKQIHAEATPLLYGNEIRIGLYTVPHLLAQVGPANAALLTRVQVAVGMPGLDVEMLTLLLEKARGLRSLELYLHLLSTAPRWHEGSVERFYGLVMPLLERYPRLERVVSRWPRGYYGEWPAVRVRLVAGGEGWREGEREVDLTEEVDMSGRVWIERMNRRGY